MFTSRLKAALRFIFSAALLVATFVTSTVYGTPCQRGIEDGFLKTRISESADKRTVDSLKLRVRADYREHFGDHDGSSHPG